MQDRQQTNRPWQFDLKTLLICVLATGPVMALAVPVYRKAMRQWHYRVPAPKPRAHVDYEPGTYYESGETPLD